MRPLPRGLSCSWDPDTAARICRRSGMICAGATSENAARLRYGNVLPLWILTQWCGLINAAKCTRKIVFAHDNRRPAVLRAHPPPHIPPFTGSDTATGRGDDKKGARPTREFFYDGSPHGCLEDRRYIARCHAALIGV